MIQVINFQNLPPEDKKALLKKTLHQARVNLLNAQMIISPVVEQYQDIDEMVGILEEMIIDLGREKDESIGL